MLTKEITWDKGRLFISPDLHGCYDKLFEKLDELDFNYDEDLLVATGDLVDRGKKSFDCFNLIYKSWFQSVRGNHEDFCLQYISAKNNGDRNFSKDIHINNGGQWFYDLPIATQNVIGLEIKNMPVAITINRNNKKYGILHGDIPDYMKSWEDVLFFLNGSNYQKTMDHILWGRTRIKRAMSMPFESNIKNTFSDVDHIYLGHTVIKSPITTGNMTFLDTGAVFDEHPFGKLSIIEVL